MHILSIWVSQKKLNRCGQLQSLMAQGITEPICLGEYEDGSIQVEDGHHRLAAVWLSGRTELAKGEYLLVQRDGRRPRFGNIIDLLKRSDALPIYSQQDD